MVLLLIDSLEEPTSLDATVVGTSAPNRDARYTTSTDVTAEAQAEIQERLIQMDRGGAVAADFGPKFWCNLIAVGLGAGTLAGTIATAGVATPVILTAIGVVVAEVGVIRTFGCWESLVRRVKAAT